MSLEERTKTGRWTESATKGYSIMNFSPNPGLQADQTIDYQVDGTLAALYLTHHCVGPAPISPFVIFASSVNAKQDFLFDIDFAKAMIPDQETMARVEEVFNFVPQDTLDHGNMAHTRLINLGLEVGAKVSYCSSSDEQNLLLPSSRVH